MLRTRKSKILSAAEFAVAIVAAVLTGPPTHAAITGQNIIWATLPGHAVTTPSLAGLTMSRAAATGEKFSLQNVHSEKCITSDGKDDTTAAQYACNGDSDQTWHLGGSRSGYYQIRNDATNQCLGIAGGSLSGGVGQQRRELGDRYPGAV